MHIDRRVLNLTAITLTILTFILAVIIAISTYRNLHLERMQQEKLLLREGTVLLHLFETMVQGCFADPESGLVEIQELVSNVPGSNIMFIYLLDKNGSVMAHTDPQRTGRHIGGDLPLDGKYLHLTMETDSEYIFELRCHFEAVASGAIGEHYLGIGLRITDLERIYQADRRHRIMMAAILVLLGIATLFFILVVQNSYLVQRTLDRMKIHNQYVVESMANGLICLDDNGKVTDINPAAAELISMPEMSQNIALESLLPEYSDEIKRVLSDGDTILNREIECKCPDGTSIPMSLSATQVRDGNGNSLGAVILLHDLREIKELNERARRAEHLASIGRMAAAVAHEIRNPLSSIRGLAQYFTSNTKGKDPEEQVYAQTIIEESDRLNKVVSELLNYARPLELNIEEISIESLFADAIRAVLPGVEKNGIEIEQNIDADVSVIQGDHDRLLQVLINLAQNSIAAMPDGGKLSLQAKWLKDPQSILIAIEDTGEGIPEDDIPRLFEPFFTTRTYGTGLGLAIVYKIIDAHSGKIIVESEEGKGTKMTLTIPQSART